MKRCAACGEELPVAAFYRDKRNKDGLGSWCRTCRNAKTREWVAGHPERRREISRNSRRKGLATAEGRAASAEASRRYREANPEKVRESARKHYRNNRQKRMALVLQRQAKLRGVHREPVDRLRVYERDEGICWLCKDPVDVAVFTLDHVIPVKYDGPHTEWNLRVAHRSCNSRRGAPLIKFKGFVDIRRDRISESRGGTG